MADVLFGLEPFSGKLPYTWPRSVEQLGPSPSETEGTPLFPFGFGLGTGWPQQAAQGRMVSPNGTDGRDPGVASSGSVDQEGPVVDVAAIPPEAGTTPRTLEDGRSEARSASRVDSLRVDLVSGGNMKTALLVVDMLNDFVTGVLANPAAKPTIEPIGALVDAARTRPDWLAVYANDAHRPGDLEFRVFGEHAVAGTKAAEVVPDLTPADGVDEVIPKRYYSAFTQTDLESTCRVHDIGRLVIVGQHTDCCVRHTTYDAFLRGLEVVVVSDATAVFEPLSEAPYAPRQQAALDYLETFYKAQVTTSTDLL